MAPLFISADEAAEKIKDRCTLWLEGGSGGLNEPDTLYECVPRRFRKWDIRAILLWFIATVWATGRGKVLMFLRSKG